MTRREKNNATARARYRKDPTKLRARSLEYYRAGTEKINADRRNTRAADPEAARAKERAWRAANVEKARARDARYMARHPEKVRAKNRRRHLRDYGLTAETFAALLEKQGGACAICSDPLLNPRRRHIDHDHKTGAVRGVLCQHCNLLLGHARDEARILASAITYLGKNTP